MAQVLIHAYKWILPKKDLLGGRDMNMDPPHPRQASIFGASFRLCLQPLSTFQSIFQTVARNNSEKPVCLKISRAPNCLQNKAHPRMGSPAQPRPPWPSPCWISLWPKQCALSHLAVIISPASSLACNGLVLPSFCVWQMAFLQRLVQMSLLLPQLPDPKQNLLLQSLDPPP